MKRHVAGFIAAAALALAPVAYAQHDTEHAAPHAAPENAPHTSTGGFAPHGRDHAEEPLSGEAVEAAHEGHGEHAEHGEEHGPPKPINWFDFDNKAQPPFGAMIINFVVLMGIYVYFGRKPVSDALKARRDSVMKEIEEAQRIRKEAEERAAIYQRKLERLEDELRETRASIVEAGKAERERIVREAEEKAARMERDAAFLVEQEVKQLRQDLTREAVELAVAAAEEILKKRVTPVDQERLAEDYLSELAGKSKSASIPAARPAQGGHS